MLKANHKYYSPRRFLDHIDPAADTTQGGVKTNVPSSGIKRLAEGSERAMAKNLKWLLSQAMTRAYTRIADNEANLALLNYIKTNPDNPLEARVLPRVNAAGFAPKVRGDQEVISVMVNGSAVHM